MFIFTILIQLFWFLIDRAKTYIRVKMASWTNGAGQTKPLHVEEWN